MSKKALENTLNVFFLISLLLLSMWLGYRMFFSSKKDEQQSTIQMQNSQQHHQSQYLEYDEAKSISVLEIVSDFYTNGDVSNGKSLKKQYSLKGSELQKGYIYIEASVNDKPLGFYDDIYLKINDVGGHLIVDGNMKPIPSSDDAKTIYFLSLDSISFKESKNSTLNKFQNDYNFLKTINSEKQLNIVAHINSHKLQKKFITIAVSYKCAEPNAVCELL